MSYEQLQRMYAGDEYYWGREPNGFARLALQFLAQSPKNLRLRAVDVGTGEGRDAVFFARTDWTFWRWMSRRTASRRRCVWPAKKEWSWG